MNTNVSDKETDVSKIISALQASGLVDANDKTVIKLMSVQTDATDILWWKSLVYLVGTRTVHCNIEAARQLLSTIPENKEARFQLLRGMLAISESEDRDIGKLQVAESYLLEACTSKELAKEGLYCLGKCRYTALIAKCDLDLESVFFPFPLPLGTQPTPEYLRERERFQSCLMAAKDRYRARGAEMIREWQGQLKLAFDNFYEAYHLGSVEALIEISKCIHASNRLNMLIGSIIDDAHDRVSLSRNGKIGNGFRFEYECYRSAAEQGLAEGWRLSNNCNSGNESCCQTSDVVSEEEILEAWIVRHNISQAYCLSLKYNQKDALPHYIAGVVHECGLCGFDQDGQAALKEFEKALGSGSDALGFVKELTKDHLMHLGSIKGYMSNFQDYADSKGMVLKYLEYEIECSKNDYISSDCILERYGTGTYKMPKERIHMMRKFRWWYSIRYVLAHLSYWKWREDSLTKDKLKKLAQILLDSRSPDGLFLLSRLRMYMSPLLIKANAQWDNELEWLKCSIEYNGGSADGNYWLAIRLIQEMHNLYACLTETEKMAHNAEIVKRLETASMLGHQEAEFKILMEARYKGCFGLDHIIVTKTPEEIADGFLKLKEKGLVKAGYEYAFCQYDQFGVKCDIKDSYDGISAAAYVKHGYGRGRAIYQEIWGHTYWEDWDRGCQEI